jgi:hypothetical protein
MTSLSPQQLAQRIAALDWSGVSLQHLLAVTAAVETLRALPATIGGLNPHLENVMPIATADPIGFPPEFLEAQIIPFPSPAAKRAPVVRWTRLLHLDGREWCSTGFFDGGPGAAWAWIVETVAAELSCSEESVGCMECSEDDEVRGDFVTVDGLPCYRISHTAPSS